MNKDLQFDNFSLLRLNEYARGNIYMLREFLQSWLRSVREGLQAVAREARKNPEALQTNLRHLYALMEMVDARAVLVGLKELMKTKGVLDEKQLKELKQIRTEINGICSRVKTVIKVR